MEKHYAVIVQSAGASIVVNEGELDGVPFGELEFSDMFVEAVAVFFSTKDEKKKASIITFHNVPRILNSLTLNRLRWEKRKSDEKCTD